MVDHPLDALATLQNWIINQLCFCHEIILYLFYWKPIDQNLHIDHSKHIPTSIIAEAQMLHNYHFFVEPDLMHILSVICLTTSEKGSVISTVKHKQSVLKLIFRLFQPVVTNSLPSLHHSHICSFSGATALVFFLQFHSLPIPHAHFLCVTFRSMANSEGHTIASDAVAPLFALE